MKQNNLTESEEKALVGLLYNHLSFVTTLKVFDELAATGEARADVLRQIFVKLLKKYDLIKSLSEEDFLLLGLAEFLSKKELRRFAAGRNMHLKKRADYFLKKI